MYSSIHTWVHYFVSLVDRPKYSEYQLFIVRNGTFTHNLSSIIALQRQVDLQLGKKKACKNRVKKGINFFQ